MKLSTCKKNNYQIEKILRFRPIAFVRKYKFVFILSGVFLLTYVAGVWRVKNYDIVNIQGEENDQVHLQIQTYLEKEVVGKNYFSFNTGNVEKGIYTEIPYVKTVLVDKIFPDTVNIFYDKYEVEIVGKLNGEGCYLLSSDGNMLENVCDGEGVEEDCCITYAYDNGIKYLKAETMSLSDSSGGRKKLLVMESIYDLVSVFNSLSLNITNMDITEESFNVYTDDGKRFVFDFNGDLALQLQRLYVVMGKIQGDSLSFKVLDLRFERPVLKGE